MFNAIMPVLTSLPFLVCAVMVVIFSVFYIWLNSDNFRFTAFAYKRFWAYPNGHRGEFQTLVKDNQDSLIDEDHLVTAERKLCQTFKSVITGADGAEVTEKQFDRAKQYLQITEQSEIHPPSTITKIGLFVLILGESMGTGYVMAPYMSSEITPAQANIAAGVLALVVAIILAIITHVAGAEMAKFMSYRKRAGTQGAEEKKIGLDSDQDRDAFYIDPNTNTIQPNPLPRRFANRVSDPGLMGPGLFAVSTIVVFALMAGVFLLRFGGVERQATMQIVSVQNNGVQDGGSVDPFASSQALPPSVSAAQQETRDKVAKSLGHNYEMEGVAASVVLSLLYFVTQLTAFVVALRSSFSSSEGEAAYKFTRNQSSFDTFRAIYLEPRIARAESFLEDLRHQRKKRHQRVGTGLFRTFLAAGQQREQAATRNKRTDAMNQAVSSMADAQTLRGRELQWGLAIKNFNFDGAEQSEMMSDFEDQMRLRTRINEMPGASTATQPFASTAPAQQQEIPPMPAIFSQPVTQAEAPPAQQARPVPPPATALPVGIEPAPATPSVPVMQAPSTAQDSHAAERAAREAEAAIGRAAQQDVNIPGLTDAYIQLPDNDAKAAFLEHQLTLLGEENFDRLSEEIKRRRALAKAKNKFKDLLGED